MLNDVLYSLEKENDIVCLVQHPCSYSLSFLAYAFVKNMTVTKIYICLYGLFCFMWFHAFPPVLCGGSPYLFEQLLFCGTPWFLYHWPQRHPPSELSIIAVWFSGLRFISSQTLGAGQPLCYLSAGHRKTAQQIFLKEWMFLLDFTRALYGKDGRYGCFEPREEIQAKQSSQSHTQLPIRG